MMGYRQEYQEIDRHGSPVRYVAVFVIGIVFQVSSVQIINGKPYLKTYLTRPNCYKEVK